MFVVKLNRGFYSTFREDNLVIEAFFSDNIEENPDMLYFEYLNKENRYEEDFSIECDLAFISRPSDNIAESQAVKIVDEVVRQIITKESKVIDIRKIFSDGYKIIEETGKYECKLPNPKRKENEPVIFKIKDGLFIFIQPENLNISESAEDTGVLEIAKCERYTGEKESPSYRTLALIDILDCEALDKVADRIAEAIADNQRLINIPKIIDEVSF